MAVVCRAIRPETGADVIGLCTGVSEVADGLAGGLGVRLPPDEVQWHRHQPLRWFREVRAGGEDALPRMHRLALSRLAEAKRLAATIDDSPEKYEP